MVKSAKSADQKKRERIEKAVYRLRRKRQKIQEWMYGGHVYDIAPSVARRPGMPPMNIIEERRLGETLFDIGKKRLEYITSYENEQYRFREKMKRKSSAVRRQMVNNSDVISRGWSVADQSLGREDSSHAVSGIRKKTSRGESREPRQNTIVETAISMQNLQKEPTQQTENKEKNTRQSSRGKAVQFSVFQTEAHFSREPSKIVQTEVHISREPTKEDRLLSRSPSMFERYPTMVRDKTKPRSLTMSAVVPWDKMKSTSIQPGTLLPPITSDPRYKKLETLLSPVYVSQKMKDITDIVKMFQALHVPPVNIRVSRLQREQQIKQFMKERGLVF